MTHADFRPKKRSGVVPSGKPRRKIPLLRILLLIGVAFFLYLKFDSLWTSVRGTLNPVTLWHRTLGHPLPVEDNLVHPAWSADSSEFTLDCPRGLQGCCDGAPAGGSALCRQASAVLAKAQARRLIASVSADGPVRLFARAGVSRAGHETWNLGAVQARSAGERASFVLRRSAGGAWCDGRQNCLGEASPQPPLLFARLTEAAEPGRQQGLGTLRWVSASASVHPVLAGRVVRVDSVPGGYRIEVYHGAELYTSYEPLHHAPGDTLKPGAAVTPHTMLGEAPWLSAGYTVFMRLRRAGMAVDPAEFFRVQPVAAPTAEDSTTVASAPEASEAALRDKTR